MNRDIHDMRFDGSEEDLLLQDFISRAELTNVVGEHIMARVYEKIEADKARRSKRWWRVAAAVAVPLLACGLWLGLNVQRKNDTAAQQTAHATNKPASVMQELAVPTGHTLTLTLPDGTRMTANSRTHIRYPKPFHACTRDIYIIGEAYFEVAHEANRPFVVHAQGFDVRVLGTHFCVNSYAADKASVVLAEGRVEVNTTAKDKVNMLPNERLNIAQGQFASKTKVNAAAYVDRLKGVLPMQGMRLSEVTEYLENYYGMRFKVQDGLRNERLYGKLVTAAPLADVLASLCNISGAEAMVKNGVVTIARRL